MIPAYTAFALASICSLHVERNALHHMRLWLESPAHGTSAVAAFFQRLRSTLEIWGK